MAVVKMSKKLREEIESKARKLFDGQEKKLEEELERYMGVTPEIVEHLLFNCTDQGLTKAQHDTVKTTLEAQAGKCVGTNGYAQYLKEVELRFNMKEAETSKGVFNRTLNITLPKNKYLWPLGGSSRYDRTEVSAAYQYYVNAETFEPHGVQPEFLHGMFDRATALVKKKHEREQFIKLVKETLNGVNSLRQFLKAWPEGESLVPDYALDELNRPTGRNKKKDDETLDAETRKHMSATMLLNKMQSGE